MKQTIMAVAVASAVALAACSDNNANSTTASSCNECAPCTENCTAAHKRHHKQQRKPVMDAVYSGVLPAADTDGIRYTLKVDYDDDSNFTKGDYDLTEEYLAADGTTRDSHKSIKRVKSEGDFTVITKTVNGKTVKYLRLQPDADDSDAEAAVEPVFFRVDDDGSVTLVNSDLKESDNPGLNYTLTVRK